MKRALILFILSISTFLYAYIPTAIPLIRLNPSVQDASLGIESFSSGLNNISPAGFTNNPARLGELNGVLFETGSHKYNGGEFAYRSVSVGYKFIGINFTVPNKRGQTGSSLHYPRAYYAFLNDEVLTEFSPSESKKDVSIGVNASEIFSFAFNNMFKKEIDLSKINFYYGISYCSVNAKIFPDFYGINHKADYTNRSYLANYKVLDNLNSKHNLDISAGLATINSQKAFVRTSDYLPESPLTYGYSYGISAKYNRSNDCSKEVPYLRYKSKNLYSIYATVNKGEYCFGEKTFSSGIEINSFDLLSYRLSYSTKNHIKDNLITHSFGLSHNFAEHYKLSFDYVSKLNNNKYYFPSQSSFILGILF